MVDWAIGDIEFTPSQQQNSDNCAFFALQFSHNQAKGIEFNPGVPHYPDPASRRARGVLPRWEVVRRNAQDAVEYKDRPGLLHDSDNSDFEGNNSQGESGSDSRPRTMHS